jgi:hypothetical protein
MLLSTRCKISKIINRKYNKNRKYIMVHLLRQQIVHLRKTPPAKVFYTGCAIGGFYRGFKFSEYTNNHQKRLVIDRICWGALCARLYTWGHPIIFYIMLRELEKQVRRKYDEKFTLSYEQSLLKILEIPHIEYNY